MTQDAVILVCFYCGHRSSAMHEAARHEIQRPESCLEWRRGTRHRAGTAEDLRDVLAKLTVEGGANLDREPTPLTKG
jgi:hypothetical protein